MTNQTYKSDDSSLDEIFKVYESHVDLTLLQENLKLTPQQRLEKHAKALALVLELRKAGAMRRKSAGITNKQCSKIDPDSY